MYQVLKISKYENSSDFDLEIGNITDLVGTGQDIINRLKEITLADIDLTLDEIRE